MPFLLLLQVAALGLEPHKHLGKSIRQLQPHLQRLRDRFGCNVCGEGGEYETLTLDCPAFTHGRIVLDEWEVRLSWWGDMKWGKQTSAQGCRGCTCHAVLCCVATVPNRPPISPLYMFSCK